MCPLISVLIFMGVSAQDPSMGREKQAEREGGSSTWEWKLHFPHHLVAWRGGIVRGQRPPITSPYLSEQELQQGKGTTAGCTGTQS